MPNPAPFDSLGSGLLFSNIAIDENQALESNLGQAVNDWLTLRDVATTL
jgi:hypothetical protein